MNLTFATNIYFIVSACAVFVLPILVIFNLLFGLSVKLPPYLGPTALEATVSRGQPQASALPTRSTSSKCCRRHGFKPRPLGNVGTNFNTILVHYFCTCLADAAAESGRSDLVHDDLPVQQRGRVDRCAVSCHCRCGLIDPDLLRA